MPTITPPLPPQPPAATPSPAPVVTVPHPPIELARLTIGALLDASIVNQVGKEAYLLQTPIGQLSILSSVALPKNASLVLQILSFSPQALLQVNSINDALPAIALRAAAVAESQSAERTLLTGSGTPTSINKTATFPPLVAGRTVKAALIRPLNIPSANPFTAASRTAGVATGVAIDAAKSSIQPAALATATTVAIKSGNTTAAVGGRQQATTPPPPPLKGGLLTATAGTGKTSKQQTGTTLPAGTQVSFKITRVQLPSLVTNNITSPSGPSGPMLLGSGRMLTGVITGTTATGHPVVQTAAGIFSLNTQSSSPRGSIITLEVTSLQKPAPPILNPSLHPDGGNANIFKDRRWPPLEEAIQVLHDVSPAASQHLLNAVLPRPDAQLTAGLVFFLNALRGGDLRPWLGDSNMRILEKTRPSLAARLSHDFNLLSKAANDSIAADWRVAMIPINTGAGIEQIRMLTRHHGNDEKDDASADQGTRFILDVDLSRMGRIQLDGLVRDKGSKLDLIIRTGTPLDDQSRNDIRTIFTEAGDLTGIHGSVSFQASPTDFIDIPDPLADDTIGLIV